MRSFTITTALLLCCLRWISVSGSGSQTVEVLPGEEVTLSCSNISRQLVVSEWFRVVNRTKPSCISSLSFSGDKAHFCDGFQNGYEMSSNTSTVFLTIKQVKVSDFGLYFCGFYIKGHTVTSDATYLRVQGYSEYDAKRDGEEDLPSEKEPDGRPNLITVILGGLTVFLTVVVIALAVKFRKLQTAVNREPQQGTNQNLGSDDLNYAALSFQAKQKGNRRPTSGRELEPNVVYAATR